MSDYIIPIDRSTIKKNPNAGNTIHYMCGKQTKYKIIVSRGIEFNYEVLLPCPVWIKETFICNDNNDCYPIQREFSFEDLCPMGWMDEEWIDQPKQEIHSLHPESEYLYDYCPTVIECSYCGESFDYKMLESDCMYSEDDEINSDKVCPYCGTYECCAITYEKFTKDMINENKA